MSNSSKQQNQHLLNKINMCRLKFDAEIKAAEYQLASVKRRLTGLTHDLYIYLALLGVPAILYFICNIFSSVPSRSLTYIVFASAKVVISFVYVIMLPSIIYNLTKTITLLWINRETDELATLPPLEGTRKGGSAPQEVSYRSEHDKLLLVLSRYYLNQDKLNELHQKVNSPSCDMTLVELEYELTQFPVYEDIQPASPFTGAMGEQVKRKTKIITFAILLLILLGVLI